MTTLFSKEPFAAAFGNKKKGETRGGCRRVKGYDDKVAGKVGRYDRTEIKRRLISSLTKLPFKIAAKATDCEANLQAGTKCLHG